MLGGSPLLQALEEDDFSKPVISANAAMMWNALCIANVSSKQPAYGLCSLGYDGLSRLSAVRGAINNP
jgi:maleate cis-trans isomerase